MLSKHPEAAQLYVRLSLNQVQTHKRFTRYKPSTILKTRAQPHQKRHLAPWVTTIREAQRRPPGGIVVVMVVVKQLSRCHYAKTWYAIQQKTVQRCANDFQWCRLGRKIFGGAKLEVLRLRLQGWDLGLYYPRHLICGESLWEALDDLL